MYLNNEYPIAPARFTVIYNYVFGKDGLCVVKTSRDTISYNMTHGYKRVLEKQYLLVHLFSHKFCLYLKIMKGNII